MAQKIKDSLPTHLKNALGNGSDEGDFKSRHHGKTQSHVVSCISLSVVFGGRKAVMVVVGGGGGLWSRVIPNGGDEVGGVKRSLFRAGISDLIWIQLARTCETTHRHPPPCPPSHLPSSPSLSSQLPTLNPHGQRFWLAPPQTVPQQQASSAQHGFANDCRPRPGL